MVKKIEKLTNYILENIVLDKKSFTTEVTINEENKSMNVQITALETDIPYIIGKKGAIIKSIRNIIKIPAEQNSYFVQINVEKSL